MIAERVSGRRRGPPGLITAGASGEFGAGYDGSVPFPGRGRPPPTVGGRFRAAMTIAIVLVPFAGLAVAVWLAWGHGLGLADILLALGFYVLTGLGVTVGFHRLLTHRSFTAARPLRIALAVAGSMSFEGDVIGWVAIHRRHHAFTDRPGDPRSPYCYGTSLAGQLRGLAHAHAGWLLRDDPTPPARYAPDMLADPAMRMVSSGFPALCAASLALPFAAGWVIGGPWRAAHLGWAAGVRWPDPVRLAAHRRGSRQDQPQPVLQTAETAAASAARDDLIDQRETARAYTASSLGNGTPRGATSRPRAAAAGTGCTCPHPSRRQACTHNRGTASPPPKLLPVHPPQQMTH